MSGRTAPAPTEPAEGRFALVNGRVLTPGGFRTDVAIVVGDGHVLDLNSPRALNRDLRRIDVAGRYVFPGYIDIHVHGARQRSFNDPSPAAFAEIARYHAQHGVTALLATTASAPIENLVQALEIAAQWDSEDGAQIVGVHLEGPYLSPEQRGAHNPRALRTPDSQDYGPLLAFPRTLKVMTLAPELPGAVELMHQLAQQGVVVSAGHSAAQETHILRAMNAGLRHTAHIFSGMSTVVRIGPWRVPGLLEVTLTQDALTAEMIADGRHLPPLLMKLAYRCKGPDRLCLVSDASSGAGLPDGTRYRLGDLEYVIENGVGMTPDHTSFAGSVTALDAMVRITVTETGVPLEEAVRMATLTPARIVGLDHRKGSLEAGKDADLILVSEDLTVERTMVRGRWLPAVAGEDR